MHQIRLRSAPAISPAVDLEHNARPMPTRKMRGYSPVFRPFRRIGQTCPQDGRNPPHRRRRGDLGTAQTRRNAPIRQSSSAEPRRRPARRVATRMKSLDRGAAFAKIIDYRSVCGPIERMRARPMSVARFRLPGADRRPGRRGRGPVRRGAGGALDDGRLGRRAGAAPVGGQGVCSTRAGNELAARGATIIAQAGEFPDFPEEQSRAELDRKLSAKAARGARAVRGHRRGLLRPAGSRSFLGTAAFKGSRSGNGRREREREDRATGRTDGASRACRRSRPT